ncbi:hypothetical protein AAF712_002862 [Marasmius tenuissimus]|uniref:Uncharacterized protein n=1 Tax=Marasmius tenuissimus TaxID=585030 RepID=A0ABR3A8V4_9AGAR
MPYHDRDRPSHSRPYNSHSHSHHHDEFNSKSFYKGSSPYSEKKYQDKRYYHEIAPPASNSHAYLPYKLAPEIWKNLEKDQDGQLEIIQGLDNTGRQCLLVYVSATQERSISLDARTEVSVKNLLTRYEVLSPIRLDSQKSLQKMMDKITKVRKQNLQTMGGDTRDDEQRREDVFWRCQYEWGRVLKRAVFDDLPIHQFQISTPANVPRIVVLCFNRWDADESETSKNTVLDLGVAYGEVCVQQGARVKKEENGGVRVKREEEQDGRAFLNGNARAGLSREWQGIRPRKTSTRRIKVKKNAGFRQRIEEFKYPEHTEILDDGAISGRLRELFKDDDNDEASLPVSIKEEPDTPSRDTSKPVILLLNDIPKTRALLQRHYGLDLDDMTDQGWKVESGLRGLFQSSEPPSSYGTHTRKRSQSPSPPWKRRSRSRSRERDYPSYGSPSHPSSAHRDRPRRRLTPVYLIDTKAIYERVSKTHDGFADRGNVRGMHQRLGLEGEGGRKMWNAAVDAELTIEIFNALIHGASIEEEWERLKTLPLHPKLDESVGDVASGAGASGGSVDQQHDEDSDDEEERDPNDIVDRRPGGAVGGGGAPAAAAAPSYEDYSDYGEDDDEY